MAAPKHYDITITSGFMDARSSPDQIGTGGYRYVKNFGVEQKLKTCRLPGWTKLLDRDDYNSQDLHDQLLSITELDTRRPITFLFEAESTFGSTKLLAGTDQALYALNITTGNWQVIYAGFGTPGLRLYAAQNQDVVLFTNDYDEPFYWTFDQPVISGSTVSPIDDLVELGVTRAGVVVTWAGCTFLMNIVQDGRTFQHRILWSNFQNALSYIQDEESVAGDQDLDFGEAIIAALPMANVLLIYTTRGIWQVNRVGGEQVFQFAKRYDAAKTGEACLAFRNTLCSKGDEHLFGGQDGIYSYSLFKDKPDLVEWVHRGSSLVYDDINVEKPDAHVSAYNPQRREVWFSWAKSNETLPQNTFVINTQFPFTAIVDHGFTAFGVFQPKEPVTILERFLLDNCICTRAELVEFGVDTQSGGFCETPEDPECEDQPDSFYTTEEVDLEDGIVMEDWDAAEPSANSLCSRLAGLTLAETCVAEAKGTAKPSRRFVMASSLDYCLKEMSNVFYREVCTAFTPCGTYERRGYRSLLRSGPINLRDTEDEKRVQRFVMEAEAAAAAIPGQVKLRIGTSAQATDPNQTACAIIWIDQDPKNLQCLSDDTEAEHKTNGTRPDVQYSWPVFQKGMNFYFEIEIVNEEATPFEDTGAQVCISRYTVFADPSRRRY